VYKYDASKVSFENVLEYTTRRDYFPETDSPTIWRLEMPAIEGRLARK
jgi:hypothetical protein